jgi:transcriptional regulator with XRE-family HTH domain
MTPTKSVKRRKGFDELRKQIDADPARRGRVEEHKAAMLGELRRELNLTQVNVAERLDVTQENVSQIERGEADVRLSTLSRYVKALGGRLEVRAAFPEQTVSLDVGETATTRRRRARAKASPAKASRRSRSVGAKAPRQPKATRAASAGVASDLAQTRSRSSKKKA